jgi:hypothetical protein
MKRNGLPSLKIAVFDLCNAGFMNYARNSFSFIAYIIVSQ